MSLATGRDNAFDKYIKHYENQRKRMEMERAYEPLIYKVHRLFFYTVDPEFFASLHGKGKFRAIF